MDKLKDWVDASLVDELNYLKTGVTPYESLKEYFSTGSIKNDSFYPEGEYSFSKRPSRANRLGKMGDVLQARMKGTDKAIIVGEELDQKLFSTGFFQIRTNSKTLEPQYLLYYLKSRMFLNIKDENCSGSTQSALNDKSAKKIRIPLAPIPIQRAIVNKVEEIFLILDNSMADLEKAQTQLSLYRQALLKKAFDGELTRDWRLQQKNLPEPKDLLTHIEKAKKEDYLIQLEEWQKALKIWENKGEVGKKPKKPSKPKAIEYEIENNTLYVNVDSTSSHIVDCLHSTPKFQSHGKYCVDTTCIANGQIIWDQIRYVSEESFKDRIRRLKPQEGDVLFAREGTVGTTLVLKSDLDICLGQRMMMFRPLKMINSFYFMYYFQSISFIKQYKPHIGGTTAPHLNISAIKQLKFPIISYQEQLKIVEEISCNLSACNKVSEDIGEALEKAQALKEIILKKAFEGKLLTEKEIEKCKQAADYEPASKLLDRIKAEKT